MYLNDILQICLLSLASRYPVHTLDFDDQVIAIPGIETRGWTAQEMLEFLDVHMPELLQLPACLLIDECTCGIFLQMYSMDRPAIHVHCRGKIPLRGKCVEKREVIAMTSQFRNHCHHIDRFVGGMMQPMNLDKSQKKVSQHHIEL